MENNELKQKLTEIANTLYKGNGNEGFAMMSGVLEDLQNVAIAMTNEERESFLNEALSPALEAMVNHDGTLLADIITYEIVEKI